jgi:hypothetical protein
MDDYCSTCGNEITENAEFCGHCGTAVTPDTVIHAVLPEHAPGALIKVTDIARANNWDVTRTVRLALELPAEMRGMVGDFTAIYEEGFLPLLKKLFNFRPQNLPPALSGWRTQTGYVLLGVLVWLVWVIGDFCLRWKLPAVTLYLFFLELGVLAFRFFYALYMYPRCFKFSPVLTSPKVISFFNGFCGGPLYGTLWNCCLTKGKIGVSHIVFVVLSAQSILYNFLSSFFGW